MKEYICQYCGQSTYNVDIDYLVGYDHLACDLERHNKAFPKKKKQLEISNWNKLSNSKFDVMGASFFISDTSHASNLYTAWVHPLDSSEAFARVSLFSNDMHLQIKVLPPADYDSSMTPIELTTTIDKLHLSNPSIFIQTIAEGLTDDPTVRDIIQFVGRKQDLNRRTKGTGYSPGPGISGSSGNNLW
jgi:hypothetical protein